MTDGTRYTCCSCCSATQSLVTVQWLCDAPPGCDADDIAVSPGPRARSRVPPAAHACMWARVEPSGELLSPTPQAAPPIPARRAGVRRAAPAAGLCAAAMHGISLQLLLRLLSSEPCTDLDRAALQ